jgi:tetratricopeptide (TPR) repeat protein
MRQGLARVCAVAAALLVTAGAAGAARRAPGPPKGEAEYREGWLALVAPSRDAKQANSLEARQKARMEAVSHLEAAAAADPQNAKYQASLAYISLLAGRYSQAKQAIDLAIDRERRDPLFYLLRGQAEAALAMMDPATASKEIGKAMDAFDRAGQLDPKNALPVLQAVSVALDVDRLDLAGPRLKQALARPESRLYQLAVPTDLVPARPDALRLWETIQMMCWGDLLARGRNVSEVLLRLGSQEEMKGNLSAAESYYRDAYRVAKKAGRTQPRVLLSVGTAIDTLDHVYFALARVAKAQQDPAAERWEGERGVLSLCRTELERAVGAYFADLKANPPDSVEAMLARESQACKKAYDGAGMELPEPAASGPPAAPKPAEAPGT